MGLFGKPHLMLGIHLVRKAGFRAYSFFCRALLGTTEVRPWMLLEETEILREVLNRLKPMRCLEWGAGYSTLYFPRFLPEGSQWIAIEHIAEWANAIQRNPQFSPSTRIMKIPVPEIGAQGEETGEDGGFQDYINAPMKLGRFNFILVDGRARNACVELSKKLLSEDGIVALHDANREGYRESTLSFPFQCEFLGRGQNQSGLWLGSLRRPIEEILDVDRHRLIWNFCDSIGRRWRGVSVLR